MRSSRVVILGTGTGVGKTHVTRLLATALGSALPDDAVGALKPIETGLPVENADSGPTDAQTLGGAHRNAIPPVAHPLFGYGAPLTPYLAALREGRAPPDLEAVERWVVEWEDSARARCSALGAARAVWSIVETAGGVFSPVGVRTPGGEHARSAPGHVKHRGDRALSNYDLWARLQPSVGILVARDGLGTLHDITATFEAMRSRGRAPDYLVLSAAGPGDASRGTNAAVLRDLGIADPITVIGEGANESDLTPLIRALTT